MSDSATGSGPEKVEQPSVFQGGGEMLEQSSLMYSLPIWAKPASEKAKAGKLDPNERLGAMNMNNFLSILTVLYYTGVLFTGNYPGSACTLS